MAYRSVSVSVFLRIRFVVIVIYALDISGICCICIVLLHTVSASSMRCTGRS